MFKRHLNGNGTTPVISSTLLKSRQCRKKTRHDVEKKCQENGCGATNHFLSMNICLFNTTILSRIFFIVVKYPHDSSCQLLVVFIELMELWEF